MHNSFYRHTQLRAAATSSSGVNTNRRTDSGGPPTWLQRRLDCMYTSTTAKRYHHHRRRRCFQARPKTPPPRPDASAGGRRLAYRYVSPQSRSILAERAYFSINSLNIFTLRRAIERALVVRLPVPPRGSL